MISWICHRFILRWLYTHVLSKDVSVTTCLWSFLQNFGARHISSCMHVTCRHISWEDSAAKATLQMSAPPDWLPHASPLAHSQLIYLCFGEGGKGGTFPTKCFGLVRARAGPLANLPRKCLLLEEADCDVLYGHLCKLSCPEKGKSFAYSFYFPLLWHAIWNELTVW